MVALPHGRASDTKGENQIEPLLANALPTYVAFDLDRIQRSSADAVANRDTERDTYTHAESINTGATAQPANNFRPALFT
jgi:hypothetical protein